MQLLDNDFVLGQSHATFQLQDASLLLQLPSLTIVVSFCKTWIYRMSLSCSLSCCRASRFISFWILSTSLSMEFFFFAWTICLWTMALEVPFSAPMMSTWRTPRLSRWLFLFRWRSNFKSCFGDTSRRCTLYMVSWSLNSIMDQERQR